MVNVDMFNPGGIEPLDSSEDAEDDWIHEHAVPDERENERAQHYRPPPTQAHQT